MTHCVAIIEDTGPDKAVGVWFPDLPGCFSAGDTVDEALLNAPQAVLLYAEALEADGRPLPLPRTLTDLRADRSFEAEVRDNLLALVELPMRVRPAAE